MYYPMDEQENSVPNRRVIVHTLATVGFIALISASMWLAVYSTRFVPDVVNRLGSAAVYLGSVFVPGEKSSLSVIPTASTTIPFGPATSTNMASTPATPTTPKKSTPTLGTRTDTTYQIGGATTTGALSGLPDLVVHINAVGYLATSSATSFVASTTVPSGSRPAVNFTIQNIGTNKSGPWRFSATIPTQTNFLFLSQPQQSLAPGDSIDYTLGFDQANKGTDKLITIIANFDHTLGESNTNNNTASTSLTIIGP